MTTLLEQMAKAYNQERFGHHAGDIWNEAPQIAKDRAMGGIRAALTVLAESDLPEIAVVAGGKAADDATEYDAPKFLEIVFKATVRAIIEEKS